MNSIIMEMWEIVLQKKKLDVRSGKSDKNLKTYNLAVIIRYCCVLCCVYTWKYIGQFSQQKKFIQSLMFLIIKIVKLYQPKKIVFFPDWTEKLPWIPLCI